MADNNTAVQTVPRSKFAELVRSVGDGTLEDELSEIVVQLTDKLRQMAEASGGKPSGAITLTIKLKCDRQIFDVDATVKKTEPQMPRPRTLMYPIPGGGLSRNNPMQVDAFRDLPREETPTRALSVHASR